MIDSLLLLSLVLVLLLWSYSSHRADNHRLRLRQQQGLHNSEQLLSLLNSIQQHRGHSSATLGGVTDRQLQLDQLRLQIDRGFQGLAPELPHSLQVRWQPLQQQWQQLSQRWPDYQILQNFQSHCEILRQLQALLEKQTDHASLTSAASQQQQQLARQIFVQLPTTIEHLGQLRALSTYAAAQRHCLTAFKLNLQYLINQLADLSQGNGNLDDRALLTEVETLLQLISQEVIEPEHLKISPDQLFRRITKVMDRCYLKIDSGAKRLLQPA
ncbi:MAG: hypothetical protein V7707_01135 [Motiliproteus sp.]